MKKDEIIFMLQQQVEFLQRQLGEANAKIDQLLAEIASLKETLVQKGEQEAKAGRIIKGLAKLQQSKSERQKPAPDGQDGTPTPDPTGTPKEPNPRQRTNYGARRKEHYELETVEEDVYPGDPRFDRQKASLIDTTISVRYELVPMRFIKHVYRIHAYRQDGTVMKGKAPDAPLLGSSYTSSFIAGMLQLRYIYSMPVERIVKLFREGGFDMDKGTAHGLIRKAAGILEDIYKAMGRAVLEDDYVAGDETYHRVLIGNGSKKGYVWVVVAVRSGLVYYFYHDGSRSGDVILDYIRDYHGAFQSDGFAPYRKMASWMTRLACLQHVKRKFLDAGDDPDSEEVVRLINELYQNENRHRIGQDGWTERKNHRWRREYAPPIMKRIREILDRCAADPTMLPKTDKYEAVHYMLHEWDSLENIFKRGDYHLDNNLVERQNRYISLSRRNSLFFGSHKGAERAVIYYSLACSCRLCGVNFFEYISDVLDKAALLQPNAPKEAYRNLLPDKWH